MKYLLIGIGFNGFKVGDICEIPKHHVKYLLACNLIRSVEGEIEKDKALSKEKGAEIHKGNKKPKNPVKKTGENKGS